MVQLEEENPQSVGQSPENQPSSSVSGNRFPKQKHAKVIENCIAFFLNFAASSTTKPLTPKQKTLIEQRLVDSFPFYHQPVHPPYAAMIETAIEKLDEKGGSSEEAISHFIRNEYLHLPWAHDTLVKHHLEKLCKVGVLKTCDGLYMTADKVSSDAYPLSQSSTFGIDSDYQYSLNAISNIDSDLSVCQIPARKRMCHRKKELLQTKRGRKEVRRQRKEGVAGEGRTREVTGLKETSSHFVEEKNHLQGHDVMPVKVGRGKMNFLVNELNEDQKLIEIRNAIKQKRPVKVAGRGRDNYCKMDLLVDGLNEDQKLIEVFNAIKQKISNKKKSVIKCL